ncbi:hypothetical protein ACQ86E_03825 [Bradyrhizobium betae]|uniref:hypothetical protein n=1 Tax=Bradyrhizobium betae TaxID=244734 RepID=UPI003D66C2FF
MLSKGHATAILYATLAECGFYSLAELDTYCRDGSIFTGHVSHAVPGVEVSTGSLGHGLPIAIGMALAARSAGAGSRVFCLLSDGECDEGSNWEGILFAPHHKLSNLCVIVDFNKIQSFGIVAEVLNLDPFADKWKAFGWHVEEIDGHDVVAARAGAWRRACNILPADRGDCPHRKGQGRELHGEQARMALPFAVR